MVKAFLSAAKVPPGEPEFVLMQSYFNQQNILVDINGNVTGIIDWDCLESVPRQSGWCSIPHWFQLDWDYLYKWPATQEDGPGREYTPDQFDRYREDYTRHMREASSKRGDSRFTAKLHVYMTLFKSVQSTRKMESFVANALIDILPRNAKAMDEYIGDIGEMEFRPGQQAWLEKRLKQYFAPDDSLS